MFPRYDISCDVSYGCRYDVSTGAGLRQWRREPAFGAESPYWPRAVIGRPTRANPSRRDEYPQSGATLRCCLDVRQHARV